MNANYMNTGLSQDRVNDIVEADPKALDLLDTLRRRCNSGEVDVRQYAPVARDIVVETVQVWKNKQARAEYLRTRHFHEGEETSVYEKGFRAMRLAADEAR